MVLAIHSLTLSGAGEGMKFYLLPTLDSSQPAWASAPCIMDAMNQSFFTLSLGIAAMEIFGSYMGEEHSLPGEGRPHLRAGHLRGPDRRAPSSSPPASPSACSRITAPPSSSRPCPTVFVNMAGGRFWGALFFLFMVFASFSTVLAVFENILAICMDTFGWSRKEAALVNCVRAF